ncbi:MAG: hydantoinase B/oxoprolinase family protein [Candidatus Binatus sp.]|nr:hydantoinase B/oxoprolinase family protein [Candidatus Binatus sp.]
MAGDSSRKNSRTDAKGLDAALLAVIANRLDSICREMTNTLLRSGRSAVLNMARDFSCSLVTGDNQLLATAEGLPVHVFGSQLLSEAMCDLHPDRAEGDAFLHNDVYLGNTHSADHTILVPVFVDGEHLFTCCAKAHQADCGNSLPTTYMPFAGDVYEEGALNFPCVRIQRGYQDIDDLIRMCRRRIRVPDQWYGDYLAMLGAARIGERRLKELATKFGKSLLRDFIREWFDYSERRMTHALKELPSAEFTGLGAHDPFPAVPDGVPLKVEIKIDANEGQVEIDLRDNIDCVPCGLNQSKTCAINSVVTGIFNSIDPGVPHNAGSFRRIKVHLRENCVVGIPLFPTSCSVATTNISDRMVNITQAAFTQLGEGYGLAEGGLGMGPSYGVISGGDFRRKGAPYVNQLIMGANGGPGAPHNDGWINYGLPVVAGLMYRDSIEIDEQKYPIEYKTVRLLTDSGGAGRFRGAPGARVVFGPRTDTMTVVYPLDGHHFPPKGVLGGHQGQASYAAKLDREGGQHDLPAVSAEQILPGEYIVGVDTGGGGYGSPLDRDPERVLADVLEEWVSLEQARQTYGVMFKGRIDDESLAVDREAIVRWRESLKGGRRDAGGGK